MHENYLNISIIYQSNCQQWGKTSETFKPKKQYSIFLLKNNKNHDINIRNQDSKLIPLYEKL